MTTPLATALVSIAAAAASATGAFGAVPGSDRLVPREKILEYLVDAQRALHAWNHAGAKARLVKLADLLAPETSLYNQAARAKAEEIVQSLAASHLTDADQKLHKLIEQVQAGVHPTGAAGAGAPARRSARSPAAPQTPPRRPGAPRADDAD
jgi:hypothetical protein